MENAIKAIIMGASVVIALVVISIGFLVVRQGQDTMRSGINKFNETTSELAELELTQYDDMIVKGDDVVYLIRKSKDDNIGIQVITKKDTSGTWYIHSISSNTLSTSNVGTISYIIDETKNTYINPNGEFLGSIIKDENGTIIGLTFTQQ